MKLSFINNTSRHRVRLALANGIVALGAVATGGIAHAQTTYQFSTTATSTSWLNSSNWTGNSGHYPGADANANSTADGTTTDIASFGGLAISGVQIGINMGTSGNTGVASNTGANGSLTLGSIDYLPALAKALVIGDSSGTSGTLTLNGSTLNSVANTILLNESTQIVTIQPTAGGAGLLGIGLGSANSVIQTKNSGNIIISSVISGAGANLSFQTSSTGTLTLSGANTFSGTFTATSGTTNLSVNSALGGVTAVSVASGAKLQTSVLSRTDAINDAAAVTLNGTLDLSGGTETVGSLAGTNTAASLVIGLNGTTAGTFTVGDSTNQSFAGVISGAPLTANTTIFTKQGTGTLTLTNANTLSGNTSITAGTLLAANTTGSATGTGTVSVGTSGTLASAAGNAGIVSGVVTTVGAASKIAPGATATANTGTVGALTLSGGLNIAAGATIPFDLAATSATSDLIKVTGGTFTGGTAPLSVTFNFNNLGATNGTVYTLINFTGATAASVDITDFTATGIAGVFTVTGTEVDFTAAVPEPATVLGGALLAGAAGWSQRRRWRGLAGWMGMRRAA